jgi:hypothetical protein
VSLIRQIKKPAAIYKCLDLWSGNKAWAELFTFEVERFTGIGIEKIIHHNSLRMFIGYIKREIRGDQRVPDGFQVLLGAEPRAKLGCN